MNGLDSHTPETGMQLVKTSRTPPELMQCTRPEPGSGEALIRVATVGMCRTDLLVADGRIPVSNDTVLGHEFSGWIEAVGDGCDLSIGDLVAADPTFPMPDGRDGFIGVDADGALRTWIVMPADRLYRAEGLSPRQAAYLEPITAAMGGLKAAREAGGRGAIVGDNRIATLTSAVFDTVGDPVAHDAITIRDLASTEPCTYDWILEARLSDELMVHAMRAMKPGGRLILKSRHLDDVHFPVRDYVLKQLSLVGRTRSGFPEAMAWLKANPDIVEDLLGDTYPLERWAEAFTAAETGEGRKVFVDVAPTN
jgi:L-iditol 2-dehydrogenase